jgi:hypothetical protein
LFIGHAQAWRDKWVVIVSNKQSNQCTTVEKVTVVWKEIYSSKNYNGVATEEG